MHFSAFLAFAVLCGVANCAKFEERKHEEHVGGEKKFKMDQPTKEVLLKEKKENVFFEKEIEYFLNNPNTKLERECFAKIKPGQSVDFVIDVAPSPSQDKLDKLSSDSPIALYLEQAYRTASRAYFGAIQLFIDAVTIDMKPEWTHTVIYDKGRKFFIRGRAIDDVEAINKVKRAGEFTDKTRNLKTLWPVPTKEAVSRLTPIVKNNLGRMTKLALWNRDNGMPIVLASNRRSKPIYTVVISDGSSGAKIEELVDDLSRATVIDLGNHRFVKNLDWQHAKQLAGVYTLVAPQQLPLMLDTVRNMACRFVENMPSM